MAGGGVDVERSGAAGLGLLGVVDGGDDLPLDPGVEGGLPQPGEGAGGDAGLGGGGDRPRVAAALLGLQPGQ